MNSLQDVIYRLEKVIQTGATDKDGKHPISAEFVLEELKSIADRPSGEWEYVHKGKWMFRRCSCCKWTQTYDDSKYMGYRYNFCPHCGARMKGAEE